jgi:Ca2+-binding RTX toxin-like protein
MPNFLYKSTIILFLLVILFSFSSSPLISISWAVDIKGSNAPDTIKGTVTDDDIRGHNGDDIIDGVEGNDEILGE